MPTDQPGDPDRAATESGRTFLLSTAFFVAGRAVAATAREKRVVAARVTSQPFSDGAAATSPGAEPLHGVDASVWFAEPIHVEPMALMDAYPLVVYAGSWAQSRIQMQDCRSRGHRECRGDGAEEDGAAPAAEDDESCRSQCLEALLDESEEWSALITGLPPGDAAENSLRETLMPRWDRELDLLWPAIAAVADLLLNTGEVDGNTVHQLVRPSQGDQP